LKLYRIVSPLQKASDLNGKVIATNPLRGAGIPRR
jgi:hypothetical protein